MDDAAPRDPHGFAPDPVRARELDLAMHLDLAGSLEHLAEAGQSAMPEGAAALARAARAIRAGREVPPLAFGTYFQIAEDMIEGRLDAATRRAADLDALPERAPGLTLTSYRASDDGGLSAMVDRRMMSGDTVFAPVPAPDAEAFFALYREGLDLMRAALPELHGEVTTIVRTLMAATSPPDRATEFDGASHYQFWGLLFLNPRHHRSPLAIVEVAAHESAHSLLFGMTRDEPLVLNPDDELFPSPLRRDPRPMDGIYHATFVSARMALAMERLADSGALTAPQRDAAIEAARRDRENFAAGHGVVAAHGRLTRTGAAIMDNAARWVAGGTA